MTAATAASAGSPTSGGTAPMPTPTPHTTDAWRPSVGTADMDEEESVSGVHRAPGRRPQAAVSAGGGGASSTPPPTVTGASKPRCEYRSRCVQVT